MKTKSALLIALFTLISGIHQDLYSQTEEDSVFHDREIRLAEIVISSDLFQHKSSEIAGSVSTIRPKEIAQANNLYLQPILNGVPGVFMQSGALNTNRITIRGIGSRSPFSTNKIKAYLNEIPLSTGEGETTLEDIDFATLAGIEVFRGPSSTMYGAGLGGAIHMLTDQHTDENKVGLDFSVGSFGVVRTNLNATMGGEQGSINVFYQSVDSEGYRDNNEYDRESVTLIGDYKISEKSILTGYLNTTDLKAFIPSSLDLESFQESPTDAAFPWANAMGFEYNSRVRLGTSLKTIYDQSLESTLALFTNISDSREVTPFGNEDIESSSFGLRGKLRKNFLEEDRLSLVLGTEIFWEDFRIASFENDNSQNGPLTSDLEQQRNYRNIFMASEFNTQSNWTFSLGGNLNFSSYENTDLFNSGSDDTSGEKSFDAIVSPKLSATKKLNDRISIYGLVAHGFSLPTFDETLNPNGAVNEDIQPETGMNYELGVKGSAFGDKLYFELAGYSMRISDLLVARRNSELDFSGFNAGSSTHNGLELFVKYNLIESPAVRLNQQLSITLMDYTFDDFLDDDRGDFSGNDLTGVPSHSINYHLTLESRPGFYGRLNWQSVGEIPILDDNSVVNEPYNILNIKGGYKKKFGKIDLDIYAGVNNVFDEQYAAMVQINPRFNQRYYYPGLSVNYFGGVRINSKF